jgi:DNA-binding winged helix-turn-helix (wHTH) protein
MGCNLTHQRPQQILCFAGFALDRDRVLLRRGKQVVPLRHKAFEVLRHLVENTGRLITKDEFMRVIWPKVFVTEDSLVQCVRDIRLALDDRGQQLIKVVPRRGYVFSAPVHETSFALPTSRLIDCMPRLSIAVMPLVQSQWRPRPGILCRWTHRRPDDRHVAHR